MSNPYESPDSSPPKSQKSKTYLTAPIASTRMPSGIPYIVGNEAAERFSFYGMRTILVVYMTQHLLNWQSQLEVMSKEEATKWFHLFVAGVYFFPILGAILADSLLGKYRTILYLSIVYCLGHLALAVVPARLGLAMGLILITLGSGGIKSCVSANVGDQFGTTNKHLIERVFGWFYFAINFGAFGSSLLTPWLLEHFGPHVAFGVPGLLMLLATIIFWAGRREFVHIPPGGWKFVREMFGGEGLRALGKLAIIYVFVMMFWSLYDQSGSAWVLQAEEMDRHLFSFITTDRFGSAMQSLSQWEILSSQVQAINPFLIMAMIPLFSYVVYPALGQVIKLTPLRKVSMGLFLAVGAFGMAAWIQSRIDAGSHPTVWWQMAAYVILTAGEIMVSITCLEFSYTQAPRTMKSLVMGLYLWSISAGNLFTSGVNWFIQNPDGTSKLAGASYYLFFTGMMLAAALAFVVVAAFYQEKTYIQEEAAPA